MSLLTSDEDLETYEKGISQYSANMVAIMLMTISLRCVRLSI